MTNQSTERLTKQVVSDYDALREDIARLTDTVAKLVSERTSDAGERVKESVINTADRAQDRVADAAHQAWTSVGRNPLSAVFVALGVGAILGMILRHRG